MYTINPRIAHNNTALRQLKLGDLGFYSLVLQSDVLDGENLLAVSGAVHIGTQ